MDVQLANKTSFRNIARILSTSWFNNFIDPSKAKSAKRQIKKVIANEGIDIKGSTVGNALDEIYQKLLFGYRNEYIYKNLLLNKFIQEHPLLLDTVLFHEFQVGNSKADVIAINGSNSVFEIKTELDSPLRLKTQLNDYYKAFDQVHLVTHYSLIEKYLNRLNETEGLIILDSDFKYKVVREALIDKTNLCIESMMKCLRRQEFIDINLNIFGEIPNVKDLYLFKAVLEQAKSASPIQYHDEFLKALKNRTISQKEIFHSVLAPDYLKHFCYHLDLTKNEYIRLNKNLNSKI